MRERLIIPRELGGAVWEFIAPAYTLALHHHSELEFNLVTKGRASYIVQDHRHDLRPGTLVWLFPRQDHVLIDRSPDYGMWIACFKPGFVRRTCVDAETRTLRRLDPPGEFCRELSLESARQLGEVMRRAVAMKPERRAAFDTTLGHALTLAWELYQAAGAGAGKRNIHPSVERAARIIRDSEQRLSVNEIAESVALSASRLSRLFKQQTGVPLVRYRSRVWLDRFLQLAGRERDRDLLSLALRAGFGSYPQFHRVFLAEMGINPLTWRGNQEAPSPGADAG